MTALLANVTEDVRPAPAERLAAARAYLERNFHRVPSLAELSAVAGLSPFYVLRAFQRAYGQTPKQLTTALQVAEVQRLLLRDVALPEVAAAVGFSHHSHMTLRFKQVVGTTPGRWRRSARPAS